MIEKSLAGPIGLVVKVSTLQDYGVDKFFFLENKNADTSQRNIVFIARGESALHAQTIAGPFRLTSQHLSPSALAQKQTLGVSPHPPLSVEEEPWSKHAANHNTIL